MKKRVLELYEAIDRCDWAILREFFAEDTVYERPGYNKFVGIEQVLEFYIHARLVREGTHVLEHFVSDGLSAACWGSFHGIDKTGNKRDVRFADFFAFEDRNIKSRKTFFFCPLI